MKRILEHPLWSGGLYLLIRLILSPLAPIPAAVALDPVWVFSAGRGDTPRLRSILCLLPGMIAGDIIVGFPWWMVLGRSVALIAITLTGPDGGFHTRFLFGSVHFALVSALLSDLGRRFPVGYLFIVWMIQAALWWGLTAPRKGGGKPAGVLSWIWIPIGLTVAHLLWDAPPLWPLPRLGSHSSIWIRGFCILMVLILPGWTLWKRWRGKSDPESTGPVSRWSELAE